MSERDGGTTPPFEDLQPRMSKDSANINIFQPIQDSQISFVPGLLRKTCPSSAEQMGGRRSKSKPVRLSFRLGRQYIALWLLARRWLVSRGNDACLHEINLDVQRWRHTVDIHPPDNIE